MAGDQTLLACRIQRNDVTPTGRLWMSLNFLAGRDADSCNGVLTSRAGVRIIRGWAWIGQGLGFVFRNGSFSISSQRLK